MKICSKCNIEKEEIEFWKRNNRKSGVNSECKDCAKERRTKNYKENRDEFRSKRRVYYEKNKEKLISIQSRYLKKKIKEKDKATLARRSLNDALKLGKIKKPKNCGICNIKTRLDGHHANYEKPLEVLWVCRQCHVMIHNNLRKGE